MRSPPNGNDDTDDRCRDDQHTDERNAGDVVARELSRQLRAHPQPSIEPPAIALIEQRSARRTSAGRSRRIVLSAAAALLLITSVAVLRNSRDASLLRSAANDPGPSVVASTGLPGGVALCADRAEQVPADPYSPPCYSFSGANGGATSMGVTGSEIGVGFRKVRVGDLSAAAKLFGGRPATDPDQLASTAEALVEYFNHNFQLYGRKLVLKPYDSKATTALIEFTDEVHQTNVDATTAAQDQKVFADITGTTQPFNDALTRQRVIAIGAPYLSDQYFTDRRPYAWSMEPSCSFTSRMAGDLVVKQLAGRQSTWTGVPFVGRPRKIALIHPRNADYSSCAKATMTTIRAAGFEIGDVAYSLDPSNAGATAVEVATTLQSGNYTTVVCDCDPILPQFILPAATQLGYFPEWTITGTGLTDTDSAAQLFQQMAPAQWAHAFGISTQGAPTALKDMAAYRAFKSVRPGEEPPDEVTHLYQNLYLLALGVQEAGPRLTPETFETGMFAYPAHTGAEGPRHWSPGRYTPQTSANLVWWDPTAVSPTTGKPGTYRIVPGGPYLAGNLPAGEPNLFGK